jgi:hypothetical protein
MLDALLAGRSKGGLISQAIYEFSGRLRRGMFWEIIRYAGNPSDDRLSYSPMTNLASEDPDRRKSMPLVELPLFTKDQDHSESW